MPIDIQDMFHSSSSQKASVQQSNGPGNTFLSEEALQQCASNRGLLLSRPGERPVIQIVYASDPAQGSLTKKHSVKQAGTEND
jgi:hypothetical protein